MGDSLTDRSVQAMHYPGRSDRVTAESLVRIGRSNTMFSLKRERASSEYNRKVHRRLVHVQMIAHGEFIESVARSS